MNIAIASIGLVSLLLGLGFYESFKDFKGHWEQRNWSIAYHKWRTDVRRMVLYIIVVVALASLEAWATGRYPTATLGLCLSAALFSLLSESGWWRVFIRGFHRAYEKGRRKT